MTDARDYEDAYQRDDKPREVKSNRAWRLECESLRQQLAECERDEWKPPAPAAQVGVSEETQIFAIQIEKQLCAVLGRKWSVSGMSIETLIADIDKKLNQADKGEK